MRRFESLEKHLPARRFNLPAVALFSFLALAPCSRMQAQGIPGLDLEIPAPQGADSYFREVQFRRGDFNTDGAVDISDGSSILNFLFLGGPPRHVREPPRGEGV